DETGVALVEGQKTEKGFVFTQLGNAALNSQAKLHAEYGGVYPNLAKREHEKNLPIILEQALRNTSEEKIDAIAVTQGPGLEPALWAGITFAENLAKERGLPLIPTNHMEGHLISSLVQDGKMENVQLPVLGLLISGGHTEYVLMKDWFEYEVIGETQDDAVGEAFDKVARMLGLPYPGGPQISKLAEQMRSEKKSVPLFKLPRPMIHDKNLNVSFSGLKTAVLYGLRDAGGIQNLNAEQVASVALEFEEAVGDIFIAKTRRALEESEAKTFVIGGGVAANKYLRERLVAFLEDEFPNVEMRLPELSITGDNAVMIAEAALARALSGLDDVAKEPVRAYSNRFSILPPK
ncbi:tRNA (adenosine(37)-N6)-threonylcarbamoyltransferase complex transferase subunit TsaD, partial [Patescibacteria group bacterium]|nr:tRNA (adenosine(37)-N6)-threonylcarbamoyltransferase complex transferase subunit TsaD [Patescibacteria group bacterium]